MKVSTQIALELAAHEILNAFDWKAQMVKTCEEAAELIVVLTKRLNSSPVMDDQIIDEIADVYIMVAQMREIYGADLVDTRIGEKIGRIRRRVDELKRIQAAKELSL